MAHLGLSEHEREAYSLTRAMRAMVFPHNNEARRAAEFEFDVSTQAAKMDNREVQGLLVPDDITGYRAIPAGLPESFRALTAGSDTGGGYTVDDPLQSIIEIFLENNFASRNVTVLSGLRGNVVLPGQDDRRPTVLPSGNTHTAALPNVSARHEAAPLAIAFECGEVSASRYIDCDREKGRPGAAIRHRFKGRNGSL